MYICVYITIYIYTWLYIHIYLCITYIYVPISTHIPIVRLYPDLARPLSIPIHIYTFTFWFIVFKLVISVSISVSTSLPLSNYLHIRLCICTYICMYMSISYIYIYREGNDIIIYYTYMYICWSRVPAAAPPHLAFCGMVPVFLFEFFASPHFGLSFPVGWRLWHGLGRVRLGMQVRSLY